MQAVTPSPAFSNNPKQPFLIGLWQLIIILCYFQNFYKICFFDAPDCFVFVCGMFWKQETQRSSRQSSSQPRHRTLEYRTHESGSSTSSGLPPQHSATDSAARVATPSDVQSDHRAPAGVLTSSPRGGTERPLVNDRQLANVSTVDRACSPFRYSELSPFAVRMHAVVPSDTWRSCRTLSPSKPQCCFTTTAPELKPCQDRRVVEGARTTDLCRRPKSPSRSTVHYRRIALEQQRQLQILESNQTLETFMRLLREEKDARATAALFSVPPHQPVPCRKRARTVNFAADGQPGQWCHSQTLVTNWRSANRQAKQTDEYCLAIVKYRCRRDKSRLHNVENKMINWLPNDQLRYRSIQDRYVDCWLDDLTLWRPLLPYGYTYKASCARPG